MKQFTPRHIKLYLDIWCLIFLVSPFLIIYNNFEVDNVWGGKQEICTVRVHRDVKTMESTSPCPYGSSSS